MVSEKENVSNGAEGREQESHHDAGDAESCQWAECPSDTPKRAAVGEAAWPLSSKENVSGGPVPLGDECYSMPARGKAKEKSCCGLSEKQSRKSIDFATVTTADLGITPESFMNGSTAKSPAALKLRRRSAIGARGSPENNTLIQYLAQQKSNRQKEAFTQQASPCHFARSLRSKMDIFQRTFKSLQEDEGKTCFSGLSQDSAALQEDGCLAQNKAPVREEHSLDQKSKAFMSDCSGADLKENLKENLANKSGRRICTILSLQHDVTEPAAVSKEWTYKQGNSNEYSEAVLIRDILETSHDFSPDHISKEVRSNVTSDQSRKKVNFAEELIVGIYDESEPPVTPLQTRNASLRESTPGGSQLRSVLKKTPVKQLIDCMEEYSNNAAHRGGGESFTVSDHICEALQTVEKTEQYSPKRAKKKKVTFGEDLSPEIFDKTLPANTPLRKGSTPVCRAESECGSPFTRAGLSEEPLTQPNFDCIDECIEPPQELQVGSVVSEKLLPVENTKESETDKSDMKTTCSSTKRKRYSTISEGTDCSISITASTKNAKDIKNPRENELQRPKSVTVSAAKKKQRTKRATFGKRRKRKVKKSLYGEREMASKKPLLSPILEIPEVFSSASSPNSPKAIAHFLDHSMPRDVHNDIQQEQVTERVTEKIIPVHVYPSSEELDIVEEGSSSNTVFQFPNVVPDTNNVRNTCDCFQQAEESACLKGKTESDLLIEHKRLQGDFPKKEEEWLTELQFGNQEDTDVHETLQRTECPPKRSSRGRPPRRRSSTVNTPPIEKSYSEMTGDDLHFSSFDVEEVLSAPQLKNNSLKLRRKSRMSETSRVRRSMRLQKDAEIEGLAWIEVTNEILQNPSVLAPACKSRRRISTSVLTESENIHYQEENLIQFTASGKENSESVHVGGGPCRRRRKSKICVSTPQETRTLSQTRKRSITNSVHRRDSSNQEYSEEMNLPLKITLPHSEVSATSHFLK